MSYRCLGDQQYEVVLTVYRDCYNGVPFFDNPSSIGVFDANGVLIKHLQIPYIADDTLKPILTGECFVLPPNACVHTSTFRDTVSLEVSPGGYTLAYQRCCRNYTILNIESPDSSGATFSIFISEDALLECNSSPVFKSWPPIYICVNEAIAFDHSAIDEEGDSIVYRLCTPLKGGSLQTPQPIPPLAPPYPEVVWRDPPYNLNNVMGGIPLNIDPQTGFLTGVPNTIGQFVVGICADEYRNGEIISSTRRDFQYNVGVCGMTVAGFANPEINCGLTVNFENISANADSFLWYFDLENDLSATSDEYNPSYTYPDSGYYTVMMIAEPGDKCVDTFYQVIRVERLSILADFDYNFPFCEDSLTVTIIDQSTDSISQIIKWDWTMTGNGDKYTSNEQFPTFYIDTSGIWIINLVVTAENGCKDTSRIIFPVRLAVLPWPDTTWRICLGDTIALNPDPGYGANLNFTWSPNMWLSNPKLLNPLAFPDTTIIYTVKTTAMNGICKGERMVTVEVSDPIILELPPDTVICSNPILLGATSNRPVEIDWALDPLFQTIIGKGNPALLNIDGDQWIYVHAYDSTGCDVIDSIYIINRSMEMLLMDSLLVCPDESLELNAIFPDPLDILTAIQWLPSSFFPGGNQVNPVFFENTTPGEYVIQVLATNQHGCTNMDSLLIAVVDTSLGSLAIEPTICSGFNVLFHLEAPGNFGYSWHFGDPTNPGAVAYGAGVSHTYSGPGTYTVQCFIQTIPGCSDTITREITLIDPPIVLGLDWTYETCADTANVLFSSTSTNDSSTFIQLTWFVNGVPSGVGATFPWTVSKTETIQVQLVATSANGCNDTLLTSVTLPVINLNLEEKVSICPGDSVQLNKSGSVGYTYNWSPIQGLSDPTTASPFASPNGITLYTVEASFFNPDTCSLSGQVEVMVNPAPTYQIPPDTLVCDSLAFLKAIVPSGVSVSWWGDPGFTQNLINGAQILYPVFPEKDFYLRFINQYGCVATDSLNVQSAFLSVDIADTLALCPGDTLLIPYTITGDTTGLDLQWSGSGNWIWMPASQSIQVVGGPSFSLHVTALNAWGCMDQAAAWINVVDLTPSLNAQATPSIIVPGQSSQITASDFPGWTYVWTPSETLDNPFVSNPLASPDTTTTYTLMFTDHRGCQGLTQVTILVATPICDDPYIFVPNTFTPNGDQVNDLLYVRGAFIDELEFMVFDRWGNQVFTTNDKTVGWDGSYKQKQLGNDVFGYYLKARCFDGKEFIKRGNVTLLRL